MLVPKDGVESGIKQNDNLYDIYKNTAIREDQIELKNSNISQNSIEASINCNVNNCQGYIRHDADGMTNYYEIHNKEYENDNSYKMTPEEINNIQSNTTAKNYTERHHKKTNRPRIQEHMISKENNSGGIGFIFIFIIIVMMVILFIIKRCKKYKSPFSGLINKIIN